MKVFKQLFSKWTPDRYVRLALGLIVGIIYVFDGQSIYLLFSVFFLVQAALNMGCGCAANNCATDVPKETKTTYHFEELNKTKNNV